MNLVETQLHSCHVILRDTPDSCLQLVLRLPSLLLHPWVLLWCISLKELPVKHLCQLVWLADLNQFASQKIEDGTSTSECSFGSLQVYIFIDFFFTPTSVDFVYCYYCCFSPLCKNKLNKKRWLPPGQHLWDFKFTPGGKGYQSAMRGWEND